jgi:hypothetical protein
VPSVVFERGVFRYQRGSQSFDFLLFVHTHLTNRCRQRRVALRVNSGVRLRRA